MTKNHTKEIGIHYKKGESPSFLVPADKEYLRSHLEQLVRITNLVELRLNTEAYCYRIREGTGYPSLAEKLKSSYDLIANEFRAGKIFIAREPDLPADEMNLQRCMEYASYFLADSSFLIGDHRRSRHYAEQCLYWAEPETELYRLAMDIKNNSRKQIHSTQIFLVALALIFIIIIMVLLW